MPMKNVPEKLRAADALSRNVAALQGSELAALTFVTLESAIALQEEMCDGATRAMEVFEEEAGTNNLETLDLPWPKRTLKVRPFDKHGERLAPTHARNCESFVTWTLV